MFVGTSVATRAQSSDGYQPVMKVSNRLVGRNFTISSQALKGFVEGVQLAGATLPSVQIENAKSQAQATEARVQAEMSAARYRAAAERLVAERPLKQRVGTQVCQLQGEWVRVGYVEQVAPQCRQEAERTPIELPGQVSSIRINWGSKHIDKPIVAMSHLQKSEFE